MFAQHPTVCPSHEPLSWCFNCNTFFTSAAAMPPHIHPDLLNWNTCFRDLYMGGDDMSDAHLILLTQNMWINDLPNHVGNLFNTKNTQHPNTDPPGKKNRFNFVAQSNFTRATRPDIAPSEGPFGKRTPHKTSHQIKRNVVCLQQNLVCIAPFAEWILNGHIKK